MFFTLSIKFNKKIFKAKYVIIKLVLLLPTQTEINSIIKTLNPLKTV